MIGNINNKQVFLFIIKMISPFFRSIMLMFLVGIVWSIDLSLRPYILKIMLNRIVEYPAHSIFEYLMLPVGVYLLMSFLHSSVFRLYSYFIEIKMIPYLRQNITKSIFDDLLKQSHYYYQNHFSGSLANKVNDLTNNIPDVIQIVIDRFFSHSLALLIATYTLWQVNIKFALVMIVWIITFIVGSLFCSKKLTHLADVWSELGSVITGKIVDALSNILSVKLFARQKQEKLSLNHTLQQSVTAEQKLGWLYFWIWFVYEYSFVIIQGFNIYLLMRGRQQGLISVGDFALVLTINIAIVDFLQGIIRDFSQFSKHLGKITQALRTIAFPIDIQDKIDAKELIILNGEIMFDNVEFHYKGTEQLFKNKSVTITSGQKVGLVGYSGSGKSTFVSLILRLFDVTSGQILIDRQDIRDVTQDSLRQKIAMIPQDPSLFHRTLIDNIRYSKIDASDEEVIEAAIRANAHDFISKLPQGYESLVGERGVKLSGGQRQRIAIARAILKNAPILILDEATNQLDSITERYIQESLWKLMQGKTTLVIAHRLSTLLHMNRILVFDKGKIVQDGTHNELLAQEGLYKTLWNSQVDGFLPKRL